MCKCTRRTWRNFTVCVKATLFLHLHPARALQGGGAPLHASRHSTKCEKSQERLQIIDAIRSEQICGLRQRSRALLKHGDEDCAFGYEKEQLKRLRKFDLISTHSATGNSQPGMRPICSIYERIGR
ncbi:hypothetical protein TRVL_05056 [Trypanosoma vivax]|nr:hypothetical protein TRVL_05056 [Trypanosoma vivax]